MSGTGGVPGEGKGSRWGLASKSGKRRFKRWYSKEAVGDAERIWVGAEFKVGRPK